MIAQSSLNNLTCSRAHTASGATQAAVHATWLKDLVAGNNLDCARRRPRTNEGVLRKAKCDGRGVCKDTASCFCVDTASLEGTSIMQMNFLLNLDPLTALRAGKCSCPMHVVEGTYSFCGFSAVHESPASSCWVKARDTGPAVCNARAIVSMHLSFRKVT